MKKALLGIACFFLCISFIQAQVLYGTTYEGGGNGLGTISKFVTSTNSVTVLKTFGSLAAHPFYTNFIQASDGKLYGMTNGGGINDGGVIFSVDRSTFTYKTIKDFDGTNGANPYGSLVQATNGKLYGMTRGGGSSNSGVIFAFDPATSAYTKLKDFGGIDGANPEGSLIQASDGKLYGMALNGGATNLGVIFSFDPLTSTYAKIIDFDGTFFGASPYGSLIQAGNGKIYGMTSQGGTSSHGVIFYFDPTNPGSTFLKLKDLDNNTGAFPRGSLIQGTDGELYGMAPSGGTTGAGVIFSFDPTSFTYTKLKDFDAGTGSPSGSLMQAGNGKLYGMTSGGGAANAGIIFSYELLGSTFIKLKDFDYTNGGYPSGSLMQSSDGKLYGMTSAGGADNIISRGVIFSFDPVSSNYATEDFGLNEDGSNPSASLLHAADGKLYGMTYQGGAKNLGVIFSLDPSSSVYTKLKDFDGNNGANPYGSLIQLGNGKLYGMTNVGGSHNLGVIFSFDPSSAVFTKLTDFDSANGSRPYGSLMLASNGKLYGMTVAGGSKNDGVIFSFDPILSAYAKLVDFDRNNGSGSAPLGNLTEASDHKLYGMTSTGGSNNTGVIFSFDPSSSTYAKLQDFDNIFGLTQPGSLIQASDGKLYGMIAEGGSNTAGAIFSFDPSSSAYAVVKNFNYTDGQRPMGSLMQASNGKLYGTTNQGGSNSRGVIFSFDPPTSTFEKLVDYDDANGAGPNTGSAFIEIQECTPKSFFRDADSDGYGNPADSVLSCTAPTGYVGNNTDCDDTKASVHPGATEICGNGIDDNCDGQVDENCTATPPSVTINDVTVNESQGTATLTVTLSHPATRPVWVLYFTKDGTATSWGRHRDYKAELGLIVIQPGSLTGTISIKIINDNITEPNEYFDVILLTALNGTISDRSGRVFITDEQQLITSLSKLNRAMETSANGLSLKVLSNPSPGQFNVTIESSNKTGKIDMKVLNAQGKLLETRSNLKSGQTIHLGGNYRPGSYFIQAVQGNQRKTAAVIKVSE